MHGITRKRICALLEKKKKKEHCICEHRTHFDKSVVGVGMFMGQNYFWKQV